MTDHHDPILANVPDGTLALGTRLLEYLDARNLPRPTLLDVDRERARRWGRTKRPRTPERKST